MPPYNFVVSCSIIVKFAVLIEFDKFFPKLSNQFQKMTSLSSYDVILFEILLYLDRFG